MPVIHLNHIVIEWCDYRPTWSGCRVGFAQTWTSRTPGSGKVQIMEWLELNTSGPLTLHGSYSHLKTFILVSHISYHIYLSKGQHCLLSHGHIKTRNLQESMNIMSKSAHTSCSLKLCSWEVVGDSGLPASSQTL